VETRPTFPDRSDAGRRLGAVVAGHLGPVERPLVLALPRGGVPVGYEVARSIGADLDVVVARKLGAPHQPELAVGAVSEGGPAIFNTGLLRRLRLGERQVAAMVNRERAEVARRVRRYRGDRPPPEVSGRTVIIVDDGLATGATARAALAAVHARGPGRLIFAAPVCANDSAAALRGYADAVLCLVAPKDLYAVGFWYDDFAQLTDDEVVGWLARASAFSRGG
jgi:putative phosphoribosyl transferase